MRGLQSGRDSLDGAESGTHPRTAVMARQQSHALVNASSKSMGSHVMPHRQTSSRRSLDSRSKYILLLLLLLLLLLQCHCNSCCCSCSAPVFLAAAAPPTVACRYKSICCCLLLLLHLLATVALAAAAALCLPLCFCCCQSDFLMIRRPTRSTLLSSFHPNPKPMLSRFSQETAGGGRNGAAV